MTGGIDNRITGVASQKVHFVIAICSSAEHSANWGAAKTSRDKPPDGLYSARAAKNLPDGSDVPLLIGTKYVFCFAG